MHKLLLALLCCAFFLSTAIASANPVHDIQDNIGVDKFAHAGVGYILTDQLERNAGFNKLESFATVLALAYVKEKYIDDNFDRGDIGATLVGPFIYNISF